MKKNNLLLTLIKEKKLVVFCCFLLFFCCFFSKSAVFGCFLQKNVENNAFQVGEILKYKISYGKSNKKRGKILAGHASLTVQEGNNEHYQIEAFGKTTRVFSLFMKVKHRYKSIVEKKSLKSLQFSMEIQEGKHLQDDFMEFEYNIDSESKNDILSAFYKLRSISPLDTQEGDTLFFSYYYNGQVFPSYVICLGEDIIETKQFGKIKTMKWSPLLEKGRVFKNTTGAFIWTTSNSMHIPVKLEIPILVGSIYVNLISEKGILYDLNK